MSGHVSVNFNVRSLVIDARCLAVVNYSDGSTNDDNQMVRKGELSYKICIILFKGNCKGYGVSY